LDNSWFSYTGRSELAPNWGLLEGLRYTFGYDPTQPERLDRLSGAPIFASLPTWSRVLGYEYVFSPMYPVPAYLGYWVTRGVLEEVARIRGLNLVVHRTRASTKLFEAFDKIMEVAGAAESFSAIEDRGTKKGAAIVESTEILWKGRRINSKHRQFQQWKARLRKINGPKTEFTKPKIELEQLEPNKIQLTSISKASYFLILRERFHSGWRAFLGNEEVPIFRSDYINRGIVVPKGTKKVSFRFEPLGFRWGVAISSLALILVLLGLIFPPRIRIS